MQLDRRGSRRKMCDTETDGHMRMAEVNAELRALRDALRSQHQALQLLQAELEEERNASASAANEAMAMISRLQKEKSIVDLEANQYKRLAEEKLAHYQESLERLEDVLYRKDEEVASLECEVQAYRHRLLSIGFEDLEIGKIKWPGRTYLNDRGREEDNGNWISSRPEKVEGIESSPRTLPWNGNNGPLYLCSGDQEGGNDNVFSSNRADWDPDSTGKRFSSDDFDSKTTCGTSAMLVLEDNLSPWERVEKLQDRLQQLSSKKGSKCYVDGEWIAVNRELQKAVEAYTASLKEGTSSCWRDPSGSDGVCDGLIDDYGQDNFGNLQFSNAYAKNSQRGRSCNDDIKGQHNRSASNATTSTDDLDSNFNVHDVYVVQHECERTRTLNSNKVNAKSHDLSVEDRLGNPEPLSQKHRFSGLSQHSDFSERNLQPTVAQNFQLPDISDNKGYGISSNSSIDPVQDQVKDLRKRLESLEVDKQSMQQTIDSLRKEKEELSLLKDVAQQFGLLKTSKQSTIICDKLQEEDATVVRFMKGILPFNGPRANKTNDAHSRSRVGLSHVLEKTPTQQRASSFINRVVRVDSIAESKIGNKDKAVKGLILTK